MVSGLNPEKVRRQAVRPARRETSDPKPAGGTGRAGRRQVNT
jgi:hypothetical protein